ncbi:MAG: DUF6765 family protein [Candidatus Cloacimonadota bacterium]|nr:DUF6765 family protein [Candidatus Cloacimonadota bacterium]
MNLEFHYYLTKYLAVEAGFENDEAEIIAYSSQYVDDNCIQFKIDKPDGTKYENYISQTQNILKPRKSLMRIYILFHFLPGTPTSSKLRRKDGKMHILMTSPASNYASGIFFEAVKDDNLYSLGIASHMMSDTFAHQNFVGTFDEVNAIQGIWEKLAPNIGHADAGIKPDIPNLTWHDPRLLSKNAIIENKERVIQASKKLYSNYLFLTSWENNWNQVKTNISDLIGESINETQIDQYNNEKEARIEKIKDLLDKFGAASDYNPKSWFEDCVEQDVKLFNDRIIKFDPVKDKFSFKKNFQEKHWYKFQEAVKEYQRRATVKLSPLLEQLEIKEW